MALHTDFPKDKFQILDPGICWFPVEEDLREQGYEKKNCCLRLCPKQWCDDATGRQGKIEYKMVYVKQEEWEKYKPTSFEQLIKSFAQSK